MVLNGRRVSSAVGSSSLVLPPALAKVYVVLCIARVEG